MADKRISQLIERVDIANNDVLPIVASGATTTNKVTVSTLQDWMQDNLDVGVTSVGLTMPSAFQVSGSPITTSGNITVTATGTASQYIRGDGTLADFPQGGGGGGASVSYYLNGSVSQGTIGGVTYLEMNKTPVLGAGTDFTIATNGYIASFITDAGDPGLLEIPGGNWNFETYFQASSGGGTPSFYVELYKVDSGGTATLIASNSSNPELIAFGTTTTAYFSTLAVPTTTLAITDRLAIRYYVTNAGRTITLHTENSNLCQIITTFTTGLTALNGLTAQVQNFATGTSGTDFNISSSGSVHTFNLPTASATNRGALSSADWSTFNAKQDAGNYVTTDTTQTITGEKTFSGSSLKIAANGAADAVVLRNVNGTTGSDAGATTMGFNSSDNLFISTQSRGGFILAFNNSVSNRTYTFQDASGTLAFTSQIPANPVGGTGAAGRVAYWNGTGTITSDSLFQWNDTFKRLGIGRTPTVSLDVQGSQNISGTITAESTAGSGLRIYAGSGTNQWDMYLNSTNLRFSDNTGTGSVVFDRPLNGTSASFTGGTYSTINSIDNVKIGSSSSTWSGIHFTDVISTDGFLGYNKTSKSFAFAIDGTNQLFTLSSTGAATFSSSVTAGAIISTGVSTFSRAGLQMTVNPSYGGGDVYSQIQSTGALALASGGDNNRLYISSTGNVGIGTASPASQLTIVGNDPSQVSIEASSGNINSQINLKPSGTGIAYIKNQANTDFAFGTNNTERMRITSGGALQMSNNATTFSIGSISGQNRIQWDSTEFSFLNTANSYTALGASAFNTRSDYRLKENVAPVQDALSKITSLKPCTFNFIAEPEKEVVGFIAHEVQEVFPQAISGEKDGFRIEQVEVSPAELDEEGNIITEAVIEEKEVPVYQGIDHSKLVPLLVASIQELKAEIEALKSQING